MENVRGGRQVCSDASIDAAEQITIVITTAF